MSGGIAPAGETAAAAASDSRRLGHLRWSLLFGNFVIGCGVMAPVGTLADIARSLDVSVGVAGQLVAVAAVMMCFGAPLLASWVGGIEAAFRPDCCQAPCLRLLMYCGSRRMEAKMSAQVSSAGA